MNDKIYNNYTANNWNMNSKNASIRKQLYLICRNQGSWKLNKNYWGEDASVDFGAGVWVGAHAQTFTSGWDGLQNRGYMSRDSGRKRGRRIMRTWGRWRWRGERKTETRNRHAKSKVLSQRMKGEMAGMVDGGEGGRGGGGEERLRERWQVPVCKSEKKWLGAANKAGGITWQIRSIMKSEEWDMRKRWAAGSERDSRGTSQTSAQKQGQRTRGASCQRATLETPLCPELVGDPWKPEHSGGQRVEIAKTVGASTKVRPGYPGSLN